jgi:hypothetical protein
MILSNLDLSSAERLSQMAELTQKYKRWREQELEAIKAQCRFDAEDEGLCWTGFRERPMPET